MAERRRRGERAEEGRQTGATSSGGRPGDEVVDDDVLADSAVNDEDVDAVTDEDADADAEFADDEVDTDDADDPEAIEDDGDEEAGGRRSGRAGGRGTVTKAKPKSTAPANRKADKDRPAKKTDERPGIFARFVNFVREVVAELRKVIWPTRSELLRYTTVVVVFVTIMVSIVGLLDYGFAKGVLWVFGSKTK